MQGYDIELIRLVTSAASRPVIACGGPVPLSIWGEQTYRGALQQWLQAASLCFMAGIEQC